MRPSPAVRNTVIAAAFVIGTLTVAACGEAVADPVPAVGMEFIPSADANNWTSGYETFCTHGTRVIASSGGGLTSVPNDPTCKTP